MNGLVTFRLGTREYATPLADVREVVRLPELADLPGMAPPLAGVLDLRGAAVPVLDLRVGAAPGASGDVLVLEAGRYAAGALEGGFVEGGQVGVAVDQVRAVVDPLDLPPTGSAAGNGLLPAYVLAVLRGPAGVVFLVDLPQMLAGAVMA